MTRINNFCAALLAVASVCGTTINAAVTQMIFRFPTGFLPTIRQMKTVMGILVIAVTIPLSACGGGGGGGASPLTPGNNTPPTANPPANVPAGVPVRSSGDPQVAIAQLTAFDSSPADLPGTVAAGESNFNLFGSSPAAGQSQQIYEDGSGDPQVILSQFGAAALGAWVKGDLDALDGFDYDLINHNVVTPPSGNSAAALANYDIYGEFTYRGNRFGAANTILVNFQQNWIWGQLVWVGPGTIGSSSVSDITFMVDSQGRQTNIYADGTRSVGIAGAGVDALSITFGIFAPGGDTVISGNRFSGTTRVIAEGYFQPLAAGPRGTFAGQFHHSGALQANQSPSGISGVFRIDDLQGRPLKGGFLGDITGQ